MGCGCGGASKAANDFVVKVDGIQVHKASSVAEARMWIAKNAIGKAATIRATPR
jgi:hypothetical protein